MSNENAQKVKDALAMASQVRRMHPEFEKAFQRLEYDERIAYMRYFDIPESERMQYCRQYDKGEFDSIPDEFLQSIRARKHFDELCVQIKAGGNG